MPDTVFSEFHTVKYEGLHSANALAYRWYNPERVVLGRPLRDHLRFAVAYWHSLAMTGSDPFGGPTIHRPWMIAGDPIVQAKVKADAAFELFRTLDLPFVEAEILTFPRPDAQAPAHCTYVDLKRAAE